MLKLQTKSPRIPEEMHFNGQTGTTNIASANMFNHYFQSVFNTEAIQNYPDFARQTHVNISTIVVSVDTVKYYMDKLKPYKAIGIDNIPNTDIKAFFRLLEPLTNRHY
jgi:hypothetical protein